jgi:hypothetical protein
MCGIIPSSLSLLSTLYFKNMGDLKIKLLKIKILEK